MTHLWREAGDGIVGQLTRQRLVRRMQFRTRRGPSSTSSFISSGKRNPARLADLFDEPPQILQLVILSNSIINQLQYLPHTHTHTHTPPLPSLLPADGLPFARLLKSTTATGWSCSITTAQTPIQRVPVIKYSTIFNQMNQNESKWIKLIRCSR